MSPRPDDSVATDDFQSEARQRLGMVPNFFQQAPDESGISENLWGAAKFAYFDNPLPSLFKERLFVYLSRFCEVRYCIARHVGFLVGLGNPSGDRACAADTVENVVDLISRPLPREGELDAQWALLEGMEEPFAQAPENGSIEEYAVFVCATHVFLQTRHGSRALAALRLAFGPVSFEHFLVFLSFVRMAHFWTAVHPDLKLEDDVAELLSVQEALAVCVMSNPETAGYEQSKEMLEELSTLRKESKQARLLETTLASIGDAVIATDLAGKITLLNSEAERLTAWTAEAALGKPIERIFRIVDETTGEPLALASFDSWRKGREYEIGSPTLLIARSGAEHPIDGRTSPIRDARGGVTGGVFVFRDVAERRKQERVLGERAKLAAFGRDVGIALTEEATLAGMLQRCAEVIERHLDFSLVRIWTAGREGESFELRASSGAYGSPVGSAGELGRAKSRATKIAKGWAPLVTNSLATDPSIEWEEAWAEYGLVAFAGYPLLFEGRALGVLELLAMNPFSTVALECVESIMSALSLGIERQLAEERTRESMSRYRLVGQAANDAIWDWNLLSNQVDWNDGIFLRYGYGAAERDSDASWWLERIHPDDAKRVSESIHGVIDGGEELWREEYRFRRSDGSYASVFDRGRVVRDAWGRSVRMVGSMLDITERKQNERRQAFLAELASVTQPLVDPDEMALVSAKMLAEYLEVNRCTYSEIEDESVFVITGDFARDVPSIRGRWPVAAFGEECVRKMRVNEPYVVNDSAEDELLAPEDREAFKSLDIRAAICVPLYKDGRFTAAIAVHQATAREWTVQEIELVRLIAGRSWESLERARTTRRLRESEERTRIAVLAADIGTWDFDLRTETLSWSDRTKEIFGLPKDRDISYDVFLEGLHPADRERTDERVKQALDPRGDGCYKIDYRIVRPDGSVRWVVASGEALFEGYGEKRHAVRFVGTVLDFTERKEAEEQLRASELFNRSILESTPDSVIILDASGHLQMMNRNGLQMMEIEDFSLVRNKPWWSIWPEVWRGRLRSAVEAARNGETDRFQAACPTALGQKRWWDVVVAPVSDGSGLNSRLIAVTRDVTLQKLAEEQLREVASRLSEADRRKDEFLATLAHELRNPLAPIRSGLEVMKVARNDPSMFEDVRGVMERQTLQLIALVDDLLDVSRITLGKLELRKSRVELAEVIDSALEASRPLVKEAEHNLTVTTPGRPIYLNADPTRLAQVVSNLLNNAIKYTPRGGEIQLSVTLQGGDVEILVADNGIGIPEEMLERIFEMFTQIDRSVEKSYTGLGIGLTLVKSLVEMHGGRVDVRSGGEGRGSSFSVRFPALTAPEISIERGSDLETGAREEVKRRVLVVDDNEAAAKMLSIVIRMGGDEVRAVHNGQEAVQVASEYRPDIILMDLGMPLMNGYEAARYIRQQDWGRDIFLVALTGWGQERDRKRTAEAGFDRHLVKPSEPAELKRVLAEASLKRNL